MGIRLMPHIEDQLILREIHNRMKCHRKLNRTEVRSQMTAMFTHFLNQEFPDFLCQLRIFLSVYLFDIIFLCDSI